jgi:hypothetical protein
MRRLRDVSFFDHAIDFTASAWPAVSAESRGSIVETLSRVVPVAVRNLPTPPDKDLLRAALRKELNQGDHVGPLTDDEARAIAWLRKASRPVRAFEDESVVCDVLDALAVNLDGSPAAPDYFSRRRRVLHKALGYAVRLPDLRRRQPRPWQGVHRRRPGPRAPRPEGPHPGETQPRPARPQAHPPGPHPARARRPAARPPRAVRHRPGRPPVPQRERQSHPAVHLVAGLAEGPQASACPRAAGHAADAPPL